MIEIAILSRGTSKFTQRISDSILLALTEMQQRGSDTTNIHWRIVEKSEGVDRESVIQCAVQPWLLLLDEDCFLPSADYISALVLWLKKNPSGDYFGGYYLTPKDASYSVKSYNELCNNWLFQGQSDNQHINFLGGCLLVRVAAVRPLLLQNPIGWGGEDTFMVRSWQKAGLKGWVTHKLNVFHHPDSQTFQKIKIRAKLHGEHREKFKLATQQWSRRGLVHALQNVSSWPLWLTHYSWLVVGKRGHRTDPNHKPQ